MFDESREKRLGCVAEVSRMLLKACRRVAGGNGATEPGQPHPAGGRAPRARSSSVSDLADDPGHLTLLDQRQLS